MDTYLKDKILSFETTKKIDEDDYKNVVLLFRSLFNTLENNDIMYQCIQYMYENNSFSLFSLYIEDEIFNLVIGKIDKLCEEYIKNGNPYSKPILHSENLMSNIHVTSGFDKSYNFYIAEINNLVSILYTNGIDFIERLSSVSPYISFIKNLIDGNYGINNMNDGIGEKYLLTAWFFIYLFKDDYIEKDVFIDNLFTNFINKSLNKNIEEINERIRKMIFFYLYDIIEHLVIRNSLYSHIQITEDKTPTIIKLLLNDSNKQLFELINEHMEKIRYSIFENPENKKFNLFKLYRK